MPMRGQFASGRNLHQGRIELPKASLAKVRGGRSQISVECYRVLFQTEGLVDRSGLLPEQRWFASEKCISGAQDNQAK